MSATRRVRWGYLLAAAVWALVLFVVLNVLMCLPAINVRAPRADPDASALKQIGYACHIYSERHGGKLPADARELFPEYVSDARVFVSYLLSRKRQVMRPYDGPRSRRIPDDNMSVIYVSGLSLDDQVHYVLAFEEEWTRECEGIHVLHVDGSVEWQTDISQMHKDLGRQAEELAAAGRKLRVVRPSWSRYPDRPVYPHPVSIRKETKALVLLLAAGSVGVAVLAFLAKMAFLSPAAEDRRTT